MITLRTKLRQEITDILVPELARRGFAGPTAIKGNSLVHDFIRRSPTRVDHLSIQFEKRQKPRFILNVQLDPLEGWDAFLRRGGTILQGRITPGGGIGTGAWFRADTPWWKRALGGSPHREKEAVQQALQSLDAIDAWFVAPADTPTVRTFPTEIRGAHGQTA